MISFGASSEAAAKFIAWRLMMMTVIVETVAANNMVVAIPLVFVIGNNVADAVVDSIGIVVAGMNGAAIPFLFESQAKAAGGGVGGFSPVAVVDHVVVNVASTALKRLQLLLRLER